jgi:hypothetical protein
LNAASRKSRPRGHYKEEFKGKNVNDDRLFPFESNTAYAIWKNALRKAGLPKNETAVDRQIIPLHALRRFFTTEMAQVIPQGVIDILLGHEGHPVGERTDCTEEYLAKVYLEGESAVHIFSDATELQKLRVEAEVENDGLHSEIKELTLKNTKLEKKMKVLSEENKALRDKLRNLSNPRARV